MFRILLIDGSDEDYDGARAHNIPLGGTGVAIFELSRCLAEAGHKVTVANACQVPCQAFGVQWVNRSAVGDLASDIVIANNDPHLLSLAKRALAEGALPIMWFHNPVRLWKTLRKGWIFPVLRHRPVGVFLGAQHASRCNRLIPLRARAVIGHGVSSQFLESPLAVAPPPERALWFTSPGRGLRQTIEIWKTRIRPRSPSAEFLVFVNESFFSAAEKQELSQHGVVLRAPVARPVLVEEIKNSRLLLYPGHLDETFCFVAAECICLGTPVVTLGIGSLSERVEDGMNGFIARSEEELAERALLLLTDSGVWMGLRQATPSYREAYGWDRALAKWETLFAKYARGV